MLCHLVLPIDPLTALIRASPHITGFMHVSGEDKVSMYAKDTILHLGDTGPYLSHVMSLIEQFGALPGFSINWSKSVRPLLTYLLNRYHLVPKS